MYRKILFIGLNFMNFIGIFSKASLLLMFSFFSSLLTIKFQPFITPNLNTLELFSNLSVSITLYAGTLYLQQDWINEPIRAFLFFLILFINLLFNIFWAFSTFQIFFHKYIEIFRRYLPKFTYLTLQLEESLMKSRYKWFVSMNDVTKHSFKTVILKPATKKITMI